MLYDDKAIPPDPSGDAAPAEGHDTALTASDGNRCTAYLAAPSRPFGAPHSFFDRRRADFADASTDAWKRVLDFIEAYKGEKRKQRRAESSQIVLPLAPSFIAGGDFLSTHFVGDASRRDAQCTGNGA